MSIACDVRAGLAIKQPTITMPHIYKCQKLLDALFTAKEKLELAIFLKIPQNAILDAESPSFHETDSSDDPLSSILPSPSTSKLSRSDINSMSAISSDLSGPLEFAMIGLLSSHEIIKALEDEVIQACVVQSHPPSILYSLACSFEWVVALQSRTFSA